MKNKIFYVVTIMILGITLFTLTGCGKKEDKNQEVAQEEKKEVKLTIADKKIVYTAKNEKGYKIPKINLAYDNIKEVNKEISAYGETILEEMKIDGEITEGGTLDYKYYENDNILSIVYEYESPFFANPDKYKVWNVDKYTGETITNEQILAKKSITSEEFQIKYTEQCKLKYEEFAGNVKEESEKNGSTEMVDFYNKQHEKTVSVENNNINNGMFLDENNEINMIAKIYSLAAADYYEQIITVNE